MHSTCKRMIYIHREKVFMDQVRYVQLSDQIKYYRGKKHLTQKELARRIKTVSGY